jgi:hypothetical protein
VSAPCQRKNTLFISFSFAKFQPAVKDFPDISRADLLTVEEPDRFQGLKKGLEKNL